MCKLVLHGAPILEEQVLLRTAHCRLFLALWYFMNDSIWCGVLRPSQVGFVIFLHEVSDCRKVISKSIFSLRSYNLQKSCLQSLTCWNPLVRMQRFDQRPASAPRSICSDTGFMLSQHIRLSDGFSSASGSTGHVDCRSDELSLLLQDVIVFCNMNKTKTFPIS